MKNLKASIDYSQTIDVIYEDLEDYNSTKKRKVLIVFVDVIIDIEPNKKLNPVVTELFLRGRKLNILLVLISRELQKIVSNHSSDIDFKDFMMLYKDYTKEPFSFLVKDATLSSDSPLTFRKSLL